MTTQATHTPGPWHIGLGNGEGSIFCESGRMRLESGGTTLYPVCDISRGWDEEEDTANARLIAAAPDLLEALRFISAEIGGGGTACEKVLLAWKRRAVEAIAKAEGGDE